MRTARLQTIRASVATTGCHSGGGGSSSEQVWVGPQMSVTGEGVSGLMWELYTEVQDIMGYDHWNLPCGQTHTTENITYPQHSVGGL